MKIVENIACTVCGCVCDDLKIHVEENGVSDVQNVCGLAQPWFLQEGKTQPPIASIHGKETSFQKAVDESVKLIQASDAPLIYGLSRSSTDGQRSAIALAEKIGATIDTTASLCHAPSIMALQEVGEVTCTLGEVKNRADLVIFWGVDPVKTHPRHMERYSIFPKGRFIPHGRKDRTMVVVDAKATQTSAMADLSIMVEPGRDFEMLVILRNLVLGLPIPAEYQAGMPMELLGDLANRMKSCRFGVVFFGLGLSMTGGGQHNVEALLMLVRDMNRFTRFCARPMRILGDVTGADKVLAWQTGYPFSVNFSRGFPRYNPGEFSAQAMLERGDVDLCLFVGSEGTERFSEKAWARLKQIPIITLDYPSVCTRVPAKVRFTTAIYGIHRPGTAYRMDGVPIVLRQFLHSNYPSDEETLDSIINRL